METRILELKQKITIEENRFYTLKTKAAKRKSSDKLYILRRELNMLLMDVAEEFNALNIDKALIGEVIILKREGAIINTELGKFEVNNCNSPLSASWYNETSCITYHKGEKVKVIVVAEVTDCKLYYTLYKVLEGGKFDADRYKELSQDKNLAFFRYNLDSKNVTGLFK